MAETVMAERSTESQAVSQTVISAVADLTSAEPTSLEPLYHVVDPEALNALFEANEVGVGCSSLRVTFTYCGCDVEITGDGVVTVSRAEQEITRR